MVTKQAIVSISTQRRAVVNNLTSMFTFVSSWCLHYYNKVHTIPREIEERGKMTQIELKAVLTVETISSPNPISFHEHLNQGLFKQYSHLVNRSSFFK